jgi:hypothetical protein
MENQLAKHCIYSCMYSFSSPQRITQALFYYSIKVPEQGLECPKLVAKMLKQAVPLHISNFTDP